MTGTALALTFLLLTPAALGQAGPPPPDTVDVGDLIRMLRHKEPAPADTPAPGRMIAAAPVIGYKPSSGPLVGVAGNVAFYRGDPRDTHISSAVVSLTYSTKGQTSATMRFGVFGARDKWKVDGDNRFQWTSQDTYGLGAATPSADKVNLRFDYFRIYETAYREVRRGMFAGVGFHYNAHTNVRAENAQEGPWANATSAGISANFLADTRDNAINASSGWLANATWRPFFKGFLGGDSSWQEVYLDVRTYRVLDKERRHKLAFWFWGDLVADGVAPYLDMPATGMDTFGRSGRGYAEGRFRGERLLYGEAEYRGTLTSNGLLGMVAFVNATTLTNLESGERLFDNVAPAAGAGLRLLINKRSRTNLCFDVGVGKDGSHGIYLAVQEAF